VLCDYLLERKRQSMKFHVTIQDAEIAKNDKMLDCGHPIVKGDIFYVLYDNEQPVLYICKSCVIVRA
jgi:hypothetical protein